MKYIIRIIRFTSELKFYYIVVSVISIFVSLTSLLHPILSGRAIDEIRKGSHANLRYLIFLALLIFTLDILNNLLSNIGGFFGDRMSQKLVSILGSRYYQHLLTLPQQYFDTELTGKIINKLNHSINKIS
ncbi:ABC transporter ATP-binding protein, partial [Candidatus Saccharibacteria bacterium]|nr:ABC transporter ATP-binding protein [Candidatus Saccharibacteria bacterium]